MRWFVLVLALFMPGTVWALTTDQQEDICANSAVIWCENWEDRLTVQQDPFDIFRSKFKNQSISSSDFTVNNGIVQSSECFFAPTQSTAGKCWRFQYTNGANNGPGFWSSNGQFAINRTIYFRAYVKQTANWKISPISTKNLELTPPENCDSGGGTRSCGGSATGIFATQEGINRQNLDIVGFCRVYFVNGQCAQDLPQYFWLPNINGSPNIASGGVPGGSSSDNQWHCVEVRWTPNTWTGTSNNTTDFPNADGTLEAWYDNVQYWNYTNVITRGIYESTPSQTTNHPPTLNYEPMTAMLVSSYWNCTTDPCPNDATNTHPAMARYVDNLVVATSRIGCLGATPPSPPTAPTNLRIVDLIPALQLAAIAGLVLARRA